VKKIWRTLTNNFWWKAGSLALAVGLWFAVEGEPELVTLQSAQVFYKDLRPDLLLGATVPTSVRLELRGPSGSLTRDNLSSISVLVDMASVTAVGEKTILVSKDNVRLPDGVTLVRADPPELHIGLVSEAQPKGSYRTQ